MTTEWLASLQQALAHNPFFSGGAVLMALGGAAAYARRLPAAALALARRRFTLSIEVGSHDEAYVWFKQWLDAHPASRRARQLMLTTLPSRGEDRAPGQMPRLLLSPAPGLHLLRHRGRWLWITLERERAENAQRGGRAPRETLTIQLLGRDREVLRELARDAYEAARSSEQAGIHVHAIKWEGWSRVATKAPRPASSVVLPAGVFEALAEDLRIFRAARDWYGEMGIPWKRGYLLHGPPGNGKSSLVLALATLIDAGLYYLNLANSEVSDESLPTLLAEVPGGSIVLIEEVDTLFEQREAKRADVKLTFGGLLNALDGPTAQEGLVVVMTTNHLERLDPALVRPGRIDVRTHLGNAAPEQARRLFRRFFPDAPAPLERRAGEAVASG